MNVQVCTMQKGPNAQQGIVLIVGLVMVLLISIIALSSIRGSGLQEAMAGNMRDRELAFQASEAALSVGESTLRVGTPPNCDGAVHSSFRCYADIDKATPATSLQYSDITSFVARGNTTSLGLNVVNQPTYVVEQLDDYQIKDDGSALELNGAPVAWIRPFRVTAIGEGATTNAQVVVQSIYAIPRNN